MYLYVIWSYVSENSTFQFLSSGMQSMLGMTAQHTIITCNHDKRRKVPQRNASIDSEQKIENGWKLTLCVRRPVMLRLLDATKNIEWLSRLKKEQHQIKTKKPYRLLARFGRILTRSCYLFSTHCHSLTFYKTMSEMRSQPHSCLIVMYCPRYAGPERQTNKTKNWLSTKVLIGDECSEYHSISPQFSACWKNSQARACGLWNMADNMCDNSHYPPLQQLVLLRPCQARTNINQSKPLLERVPPTQLCWMICDCLLWSRIFKGWANQKKRLRHCTSVRNMD